MSLNEEKSNVMKQTPPVSHTGPGTSGTSSEPPSISDKPIEDGGYLPGQPIMEPTNSSTAPPIAQQPAYGQPAGYGPLNGYPPNAVVIQRPRQLYMGVRPSDCMTLSIVSFFCCWPMAICAIMYSCNSKSSADAGDYARAESEGRTARNISIVAIILGLIILAVSIGVPLGLIFRPRSYTCTLYGCGYY